MWRLFDMQARANFWERYKANRLSFAAVILLTLTVGILIGTIISYGVKGQEKDKKSADATQLTIPSPRQLSNQFSQIAKTLEPAVVNINTESTVKPTRRRGGNDQDGGDEESPFGDFFDKFFGGQGGDQGPIRERSLGSGVVVDSKGFIITNRHVVEKADRIRVHLQDDAPGVQHDAKVIGSDQETDLAVIKVDVDHALPTAKLAIQIVCRSATGCSPLVAHLVCKRRLPRESSLPRVETSSLAVSSSHSFRPMQPSIQEIQVDRW